MIAERTIPIIIGVTGHRAIREQDRPALTAAVKTELEKLRGLCPHSPLVMLNSLAEGADLLCADVAEKLNIPLIAVLPRERTDYEQDFGPEALARFAHHCERAEQVFVSPNIEPIPPGGVSREYEFRQVGIYVAAHCHVLLALWDGEPGKHGCGTAETVNFALNGSYNSESGLSPRSGSNEAVIHLFTPREENAVKAAGTAAVLGSWDAVLDILRKTDDFNQNATEVSLAGNSRLPAGHESDPALEKMEAISLASGKLSRQYAMRYRRVLGLLAVASALLTFAFLMYDEAQAIWMILVCGALLVSAWGCQRYAVRSDCHRRYIEYRALSECLRVQTYLRYAGSRIQASELLSWSQQEETAWILDAICALTIGNVPGEAHDIRSCWVETQREYHQKAAKGSGEKLSASDRTVHFALILSVGLYLLGVAYELFCGGLIFRPSIEVVDVEFWRTVLKILMGTISAVTLFVANFYGRLSLPRILSDHRKMERFYAKMSAELEEYGQTELLLTVLSREELTENGNWCSYQRDNKPDVSI